jgi:nucleotide-binding universal stress UspA family protein
MKKILIATDFSPAALDATLYGVKLAAAFEARVTLVTAFEEITIPAAEAMHIITNEDMRGLARRQMEKEKHRLSSCITLPIDTLLKKGPVVRAILAAAEETQADLIVVGMTGTEKDIRRSFGSAATTLAQKTPVPLLVIPEEALFKPPIAIALAEDVATQKQNETPEAVRQLLAKFHARLFVVRVFNKQQGEVVEVVHDPSDGRRAAGAFSPLQEIAGRRHVAQALENFIETNPVGILVIQPQPHSLPERWFRRSNTKEMIFLTSIPLLILPPATAAQNRAA